MKARLIHHLRRRTAPCCRRCTTLRAQNTALRRENQQLRQENATYRQQIMQLRERLGAAQRAAKRQAAPFSKGPPKIDPRRPGRKPGAHYGVKARRPIPQHLDEFYEVALPERCPHCEGDDVIATGTAWQYQEEIPPVKPLVRGFRVHLGRCVRCRRAVRGRHPLQTSTALGAAAVHLGPHALALAADLNKRLGTPFGKLSQLLHIAFSLSITPGGLSLALGRLARVLAPTYNALVACVRRAPLAAADETGWKVGGHLQWLWVFVSETVTVYAILDGRGYPQACAVLGADFAGILLRDGWSPYRRFARATHQTCVGGHLLRRCRLNLETAARGEARLPHAILRVLQRGLRLRDHWLAQPPTPHGRAIHAGRVAAEMDRYLAWKPTDHENQKLVQHLRHERDALFTFLRNPRVPASNWWAEQALRPAVVTRKVWGGNRTPRGAITQHTLASVLRTCQQLRVDPYPLLEQLLRSPLPQVAALPLLPSGP